MWLYWAPLFVVTWILAPMPSRLLLVPSSAMSSQCPAPGLRFIQISAGWARAVVTKIGRASCRERGEISVVAVSLKKKKKTKRERSQWHREGVWSVREGLQHNKV